MTTGLFFKTPLSGIQKINKGRRFLILILLVFKFSQFTVYAQSPYCDPNYTGQSGNCTTYGMSINAIEIKQSSNVIYTRAHNTGGYNGCTSSSGQYTFWSSSSMFTLKVGGNYTIGFTTGPTYSVGIGVWIDLNGDNDFADAEEWRSSGWCTPLISPGSSTLQYFNLSIPVNATVGTTRMRIRSTYNSCTANDNGCTSYNYGEAEDFTITLSSEPNDAGITNISPPKCQPLLTTTISNLGSNDLQSVKIGWAVNGKFQNVNTYSKTITKGKSADIILSPTFNFSDATSYQIKVFTMEPNSVSDPDNNNDTSILNFVYYSQPGKPNPQNVSRCGIGSVQLNSGLGKNGYSLWYGSNTSTEVLAIDSIFNTPTLPYGNKTYYIEGVKLGDPTLFTTGMSGTYWFGNIQSGNMFDIKANKSLIIDSFSLNVNNYNSIQVNVYVRSGSYVGYQTNSSSWTLIKTINGVQAKGLGNKTNVNMGGYLMPAGNYGVYVQVSEGILFNLGNQNRSNIDLTFVGGDAISGNFGSITSNYTWSGNLYYRPVLCTEKRVPVDAIVNPSPFGSSFTKSIPFQTTRPNSRGTISDPDIVTSNEEINYELNPPSGYFQSDYGKKWKTENFRIRTLKGNVISGKYYQYLAPSNTQKGTLRFVPDTTLTDSIIHIQLVIKDMGPYYCDSTINKFIFVAPRPQPNFNFNKQICDGDAVLFENQSRISSGNMRYKWYFGTGNPEDTSDAFSTIFKFPAYGKYKVSLTATSIPYGYETTKTILVEVTEIPRIDFKILNACENIPLRFINNTSHTDTVSYFWDFGDPSSTNDVSQLKHSVWTYPLPGAYQVTLKATAKGCQSILTKNANQFATPIAGFSAPSLICDKTEIKFTNSSLIKFGNMGYHWTFGDGDVSNEANPTHIFKNSTSKTVVLKTVSEFGCIDSTVKILYPVESPLANFNWNSACNLTTTKFTFTGTIPLGGIKTNYYWNFSGESNSTQIDPEKLFSQAGKKSVTLSLVADNGCSNEISKEVFIKQQSKSDFEVNDICEDDEAVFINKSSVSSGALKYNWKFGDGKNSNALSPRHKYNIGGTTQTYNVTLVAIVTGGCSDSVTKAVTVNAKPNSDFNFKSSGRLVYFNAINKNSVLYQWRFGDGGSAITPDAQWHYLSYPSGKYKACLSVVDANSCFSETCKDINVGNTIQNLTNDSEISVYPNPSNGSFRVNFSKPMVGSIKLYTNTGKLVHESNIIPYQKTQYFNLNLSDGLYILMLVDEIQSHAIKIVIQK